MVAAAYIAAAVGFAVAARDVEWQVAAAVVELRGVCSDYADLRVIRECLVA